MKYTLGSIIGSTAKGAILGTNYLSKKVNDFAKKHIKDEKLKSNICDKFQQINEKLEETATPVSLKLEKFVGNAIIKTEDMGDKTARHIAQKLNASEKGIEKAGKIGKIIGKATASGVTASAAVYSVGVSATTVGASVFTHGMAILGAGSMYVGLATVSVIAGSVFNTRKENIEVSKEEKKEDIKN